MTPAIARPILALFTTIEIIGAQDIIIRGYAGALDILISVFAGNGIGFLVRYVLDKRFIVRFRAIAA